MLNVRAQGIFSEHYEIRAGQRVLTTVSNRWLGEGGSFLLDGGTFTMGRRSMFGGEFFVEHRGEPLATAIKPSAFLRRFTVTVAGDVYQLSARSPFRRSFSLRRGGREVGAVEPTSIFTRSAEVELPEELSPPVQVFVIWLVLLLWRRQRNSSS